MHIPAVKGSFLGKYQPPLLVALPVIHPHSCRGYSLGKHPLVHPHPAVLHKCSVGMEDFSHVITARNHVINSAFPILYSYDDTCNVQYSLETRNYYVYTVGRDVLRYVFLHSVQPEMSALK